MTVKTVLIKPPRPWLPVALLGLLVVTIGALVGAILVASAPRTANAEHPPVSIVATPTAGAAPQLVGYFDYKNPATRTAVDPAQFACVDGSAVPDWVLVVMGACDDPSASRAWLHAEQVSADVPIASLAALDVQPTQPTQAPVAQQPAVVYYAAPTAPPVYIEVVATAILPEVPRAGQPMTADEAQAAAAHEKPADKPAPGWHAPLTTDQGEPCGGATTAAPMCH